jgi:hypothetical protein
VSSRARSSMAVRYILIAGDAAEQLRRRAPQGRWPGLPNCTLIARTPCALTRHDQGPGPAVSLTWAFVVERVTRIELALSAWESDRSVSLTALTWASDAPRVPVIDPATLGLMARQWPMAEQVLRLAGF